MVIQPKMRRKTKSYGSSKFMFRVFQTFGFKFYLSSTTLAPEEAFKPLSLFKILIAWGGF